MRTVAAIVILFVAASVAEAQVTLRYEKKGKNYSFSFEYSSGGHSGYGHGGYGFQGYGFSYGHSHYGGYYGSSYYPGYYGNGYTGSRPYPPPPQYYTPRFVVPEYGFSYETSRKESTDPDEEMITRLTVSKEVEEGIALFKMGHTDRALDKFKDALVRDTDNPLPQIYMGVALAHKGKYRSADTAFASAIAEVDAVTTLKNVKLDELFRAADLKRFRRLLAKHTDGDGALTAVVVSVLSGEKKKAGLAGILRDDLQDAKKKLSLYIAKK